LTHQELDQSQQANTRRGRSGGDIGDWRDIYTALDRAKTTGTAIGATITVSDPKWAPKHYSQIAKIQDTNLRNTWYKAHFDENDPLFDHPDVAKLVPLPDGITIRRPAQCSGRERPSSRRSS